MKFEVPKLKKNAKKTKRNVYSKKKSSKKKKKSARKRRKSRVNSSVFSLRRPQILLTIKYFEETQQKSYYFVT